MLYSVRIKMISPMLGKNSDAEGVRRFATNPDGEISIDPAAWHQIMRQAATDLHVDIDITTIRPAQGIRKPTTIVLRRRINPTNIQLFEAVREGADISFEVAILDMPKSPDAEQLKKMLEYVGKFVGISQYGTKFNYGRFSVISLTPL